MKMARAASIHPDMLSARLVSGDRTGRQLLNAVRDINAMPPLERTDVADTLADLAAVRDEASATGFSDGRYEVSSKSCSCDMKRSGVRAEI